MISSLDPLFQIGTQIFSSNHRLSVVTHFVRIKYSAVDNIHFSFSGEVGKIMKHESNRGLNMHKDPNRSSTSMDIVSATT